MDGCALAPSRLYYVEGDGLKPTWPCGKRGKGDPLDPRQGARRVPGGFPAAACFDVGLDAVVLVSPQQCEVCSVCEGAM